LLGVAAAVAAQDDIPPSVKVTRIEVTGSNIARVEGESGLPVQVITRQELLDGGVQTMQDLLERISANQSFGGWNEAKGIGSTLVGFTGASLRGLGSQRTLVLLNGRRLAPYALSGGQSVDLSGIPPSALERVEVLKDGASAVYGTDALGGVINFILRRDFEGIEANANYFATEQGGGNNWRASATAGVGDLAREKYNLFLSADYYRQDSLKASQRESTKTAYLPWLGIDATSANAYPANIAQTVFATGEVYGFAGRRNPTIPFPEGPTPGSCAPPVSISKNGRARFECGFDYASVIDAIPELDKANVVARFTGQIDRDHQFFAESSYYRGRFTQRISPAPVNSAFTLTPMTLPPTSPHYPAAYVAGLPGGDPAAPLELWYRTVDLGPRVDRANVNQWNAAVGMQGTVKGWDYALAGTYTSNRQVDDLVSGYVYESKFGPLLRSGAINPFGPNTGAVLEAMRATQVTAQASDNRASNYGVDLKLANALYKLPAGPLAVALGAEARRESLEQSNSEFMVGGDVLGGAEAAPSIASVHRSVRALLGEVDIPITATFQANIALRYDYYSDFGGTTNPKLTLRWQPASAVVLRAAYGTGFRAPTLADIFLPPSRGIAFTENVEDPVRCPITQAPADCLGLYETRLGGNPALRPETSRQANAGVVVAPTGALSVGFDYYWVKVKNVIGVVPLDTIFSDFAHWSPDYVVRDPPDAQHPNLPGQINYIVQYPTNVGDIATSGVDFNLQWRGTVMSFGQLSLVLNGTYVIAYTNSGYESETVPSGVGTRGADGAIARYRQYAQLNWIYGSWGATLANTFQTGYSEPCTDSDPSGCTTRRVGSSSIWDIQGRYAGFKDLTLTLGIRNALDAAPPVSNQRNTFQVGFDPTYADPRGRMFYGAVRYVFR